MTKLPPSIVQLAHPPSGSQYNILGLNDQSAVINCKFTVLCCYNWSIRNIAKTISYSDNVANKIQFLVKSG